MKMRCGCSGYSRSCRRNMAGRTRTRRKWSRSKIRRRDLDYQGLLAAGILNRHADKLAFRVERAMEGPLAVVAEIGSAGDSEGAGFLGGLLDLHLVGLERESVDRHLV